MLPIQENRAVLHRMSEGRWAHDDFIVEMSSLCRKADKLFSSIWEIAAW